MTRIAVLRAGFPPLQTQIAVSDRYGAVFARIDMGWRKYRDGVEFDGAQHWTDSKRRTWDIDRLAKLEELGWMIVRVSSGLLHNRPEVFLRRVGGALSSRGCPMSW